MLGAFLGTLADTEADAFLLGGDTGEAHDPAEHLEAVAEIEAQRMAAGGAAGRGDPGPADARG